MSIISDGQNRRCSFQISLTLVAVSLLLTLAPLVGDADETAGAQPQPQLGVDFKPGRQPTQDGLVFSGQIRGEPDSSAVLVLAQDYRASGRLRWQSSDKTLGVIEVDFFRPRSIKFRGKEQRLLDFIDLSPMPTLVGTVSPLSAVVNVGILLDIVRYRLELKDVGIELAGAGKKRVVPIQYTAAEINEENFAKRKCRLKKLRITGLGSAVLDVSTPDIIRIFGPDGRNLDFPVRLQALPADLLLGGIGPGTTTLQATYALANSIILSKRKQLSVKVGKDGAAPADCPANKGVPGTTPPR